MNSEKLVKKSFNGTLWFSGLPCSGKTTIAKILESRLKGMGYLVARLDGDDVRESINSDLKFSKKDREENLRRIGHIAQLFNNKGMIVLASFIAPLEENRQALNSIIDNFNLIFVKCRLEKCSERDVKGMYDLAKRGKIREFTGVSAPFEEPENTGLILDTENFDPNYCVDQIIEKYF